MYKKLIEKIAFRKDGLTKKIMRTGLIVLPLSTFAIAKYLPEIAKRKGNKLSEEDIDELKGNRFGFETVKTIAYGLIAWGVYTIFS